VHELGLDKIDVRLVMKLMEQGYATRMITESTHGKTEEFIHPALEVTRRISSLLLLTVCSIIVYASVARDANNQKKHYNYRAASDVSFRQ
jgi:hypothetical protein